jgi:hypothetical protein
MATVFRKRKLYMVRIHNGNAPGKQVGYKSRLVPRKAALRVASRLRRSMRFDWVEIYPLEITVTPEQIAYLDRRYS